MAMWVARDKDGHLYAYEGKPEKNKDFGSWCGSCCYTLSKDFFPEVKWEDEEPRELILK